MTQQKPKFKTWHKVVIAIIVVIIIGNIFKDKPSKVSASTTSDTILSEKPKAVENWQYTETTDKMTDKVNSYAINTSTNTIEFDFPYNGGSFLSMHVRNSENGNEVLLKISKGQFMSSFNNGVKIKFDEEPVKSYGYSEPADGASDFIFLDNGPQIIKKLKTAKKIKVQPLFFQEGQTVFEFDVEGLKWDY